MKNFEMLYMTAPSYLDHMSEFYNGEGKRDGFPGVYTEKGYYLASEIARGKGWYKWFSRVRELGAVQYKQALSYYSEDNATVITCDLQAYDKAGKQVGFTKLAGTRFGASESDHRELGKAWEADLGKEFNAVIDSVETFLQWQGWVKAKGL